MEIIISTRKRDKARVILIGTGGLVGGANLFFGYLYLLIFLLCFLMELPGKPDDRGEIKCTESEPSIIKQNIEE